MRPAFRKTKNKSVNSKTLKSVELVWKYPHSYALFLLTEICCKSQSVNLNQYKTSQWTHLITYVYTHQRGIFFCSLQKKRRSFLNRTVTSRQLIQATPLTNPSKSKSTLHQWRHTSNGNEPFCAHLENFHDVKKKKNQNHQRLGVP